MNPNDEGGELYAVIRKLCDKHKDLVEISPGWLATEAMVEIEFTRSLHALGYIGCHLQLRQIARGYCRKQFDPVENTEQDFFPDTLQPRYPLPPAPNVGPRYVLLDHIDAATAFYNVTRLRKSAAAQIKHADALQFWAISRFGDYRNRSA